MTGELIPSPLLPASPGTFPVPALIADAGEKPASISSNSSPPPSATKTRARPTCRPSAQFCRWCEEYQLQLHTIRPLHVSAYIESKPLTAPSVKQHLAALRGLFNWLVIKQVVPDNPALFVKGPRFSRQIGITPILEPDQMRKLLDSIPVTREVKIPRKHGGGVRVEADVKGLRDRAIIAIMAYTFARVSAVLKLKRGDYSLQGKRARLRLLEKGGQGKARLAASRGGAVSRCLSRSGAYQRGGCARVSDADKNHRLTGAPLPARYAAYRQGTLRESRTPGEHLQSHLPGHRHHRVPAERRLPGSRPGYGESFRPAHHEAL
jgi:integrase